MDGKQHMLVAAKTFLTFKNRVLLVRRSESDRSFPGVWEFPGGKLEQGESPVIAAERELLEETGINGMMGPVLYAETSSTKSGHDVVVILYLASTNSSHVALSFEHSASMWASKAQLRELLMPGIYHNLERYGVFVRPDVSIEE